MSVSLGELAVRFGCELRGDPQLRIESVGALDSAGSGSISFLANPRLRRALASTQASAVVLEAAAAEGCPVAALIADNPHAVFARIAALLHPLPAIEPGHHASAIIAPDADVDPSAQIGPLALIGPRCHIGPRAFVGPGCILGAQVRLGADSRLTARVTLVNDVHVGARVIIHPGAVLGADGFGLARESQRWLKVPQCGGVRIGDDVEIGANTTIDRGALEDTVIEEGVKLDNQIQIGHNVRIGAHTAIAGCTGISGSTHIGRRCMIGGAVAIAGHLRICDDTVINGMAMVTQSISVPGVYASGIPAAPARIWRRMVVRLRRLAERDEQGPQAQSPRVAGSREEIDE
jgi:UDP-3-O-[3-hydroxymyristoyl] glucosamine N-acyltransferase